MDTHADDITVTGPQHVLVLAAEIAIRPCGRTEHERGRCDKGWPGRSDEEESGSPSQEEKWAVPPRHVGAMSEAQGFRTTVPHVLDIAGIGSYRHPRLCVQPRSAVKHKHSKHRTTTYMMCYARQQRPQTRHWQASTCAPAPLLGRRHVTTWPCLPPLLRPCTPPLLGRGPRPCAAATAARPCAVAAAARPCNTVHHCRESQLSMDA